MRERPDLMAARAQVRAAQARVSIARGNALPSLVLGGNAQQTYFFDNNPGGSGYTATITLQIPLFAGGSHIYNIKAAAAAAQAAAQQQRGLEQQVVYEVFRAYYTLRTTSASPHQRDLLASATESEKVAWPLQAAREECSTLLPSSAPGAGREIQARSRGTRAHSSGTTPDLGLDGSRQLHVQPTDHTPDDARRAAR